MRRPARWALVSSVGVAAAVGAWLRLRPRITTWGTTGEEARKALPGDELIAGARYVTTRAITVGAPAARVWPWLVQMGQNRGGFYSYDRLENLLRLDIHSAGRIHPEWQDLKAGEDYVTLDKDQALKLTICVLEPGRAFVLRTGAPGEPQEPGDFFGNEIAATWAFVLEPVDERTTRLIIRWRAAFTETRAARLAQAALLEPVHFLMEEAMLRGIRDRAEGSAVDAATESI